MPFDKDTRNQLARMTAAARKVLVDEFTAQLQGVYGIQPDGKCLPLERLSHLSDEDRATARLLRQRHAHLASLSPDPKHAPHEAVDRILRELAFTVLNRFCALRMCEERGLVQECVRNRYTSTGFKVYLQLSGASQGDTYQRYRVFLECLEDELAVDLGVLFDRRSPQALLFPREAGLMELLDILDAPELRPLWSEDETIGWIYQYYNDPAERKKMRDASAAPRNSRELAVRNQFFTPRYVVCFLSDNTLGRIWYEMTQGQTSLAEQCQYLVRRPDELFFSQQTKANGEDSDDGTADAARMLQTGDKETFPEFDASEESIQRMIALAHTVDGYVRHPAGEETFAWMDDFKDRVLLPSVYNGVKTQDLLDALFLECRKDRQGGDGTIYGEPWFVNACNEVRRRALRSREEGLSQEDLLRQPVFIPHRPLKDPREIRLLDPACGSMHFGLYAFDLFEVIYREAWELLPDFREEIIPSIDPNSIQISWHTGFNCAASGEPLTPDTAVLAVWPYDAPGQTKPGRLLLYSRRAAKERADRLSFCRPLVDVNWQQFLQEQWAEPSVFLNFLTSHEGFTFQKRTEAERYEAFLKEIPRLIIEHNIHGIDIDPRAVQIAGLSLWLRAQKAWQTMGLKAADRPRVLRANIVCAEPMPGDEALLDEFCAKLNPPLLGDLVKTVFEHMKLAGEAGSLLKIEEELRDAIERARSTWQRTQNKSAELFNAGELNPSTPQPELELDSSLVTRHPSLSSDFWATAEDQVLNALRLYAEQADSSGYRKKLFAEDAARGFAFIDLCRKRYDAVVMNPPFGTPCKTSKKQLSRIYPRSKNEIYGSFVERTEEMLVPRGLCGAITSRAGYYVSSLESWRKDVVASSLPPVVFADLGNGVLDSAMVETAACVLQKAKASSTTVFFQLLSSSDKASDLCLSIHTLYSGSLNEITKHVSVDSFAKIPGSPFAYWVSEKVRLLFRDLCPYKKDNQSVKQGLATSDDFRFVRTSWEVPAILKGTTWFPMAKGGETSLFYADLDLVINWGRNGDELKSEVDRKYSHIDGYQTFWVVKNPDAYFLPGITYPLRAARFCPQALPSGAIISVRGSGIYSPNLLPMLGLLASKPFDMLLKMLLGRGGHPQFDMGDICVTPTPELSSSDRDKFASLALNGWEAQRSHASVKLVSSAFVSPELATTVDTTIGQIFFRRVATSNEFVSRTHSIRQEIDALALGLYGIQEADCKYLEPPICDVDELEPYLGNSGQQTASVSELVGEILEYELGTTYARWDIRYATGERQPPPLPDPFDPLPVCPPGMLQNAAGLPAEPKDVPADYPLRLSWSGILVDDPGHSEDIVTRVRESLEVIWKERHDAIEQEACDILGLKSLRDYFRKPAAFFADHLKRYSKSRRKAPIYWPLSTASGSYTLWLYYHRLNDQTLYTCVNDFVDPKLKDIHLDLERLQGELQDVPNTELRKQVETLHDLRAELSDLKAELLRVAALPWIPNLNDGVLITAAPLWKLFNHSPWQKACKECWGKLEAGDYDWAHLAHSIWPTRVETVCKTDKSIAIAHNLEHLYQEPPPKPGKATQKRKSKPPPSGEDDEYGTQDEIDF